MSLRGCKRAAGVRGDEPVASKRRRGEPEDALWQLRPVSDLKMSSIYNRNASEAPAELFRKDLISAMKLPDSEPLTPSEYWIITDTWKQDWERGVQVPVNPDSLPAPKVKIIDNPLPPDYEEYKIPKDKYIHLCRDAHYQPEKHLLSTTPARAEAACSYDLDATDTAWLKLLNAERARAGASPINENQLEKVIEELEVRTWDKIQAIMKSEEGLGIEYDENVICDVCRSPDSEDGNEMVFCDSCNICVHQACYGITVIPEGQWLCRPCGDGVRPTCVLCPNLGGAMKCTPSGHKWAHVSCVLWIPEVSIGCAENMEPITKISAIPASRWSLVCILCRERKGACIQCSVKTCKTAYHVTCAFKHGLEMRAIIEDENADDGVKLRSYCQKHSVNSKKEKCPGSGSEEEEVKRKRRKDMTSEEKSQARAARLQEIEREFDRHVSVKDISTHLLDVDQDAINYIYNYWKLKRRAGHNRPLLPPKTDDNELLTHRQEQADIDKMKMFVQLRQDLERVRNLCYMVSRREKLSRSYFRMREQTFHKQVGVLEVDTTISSPDLAAIVEANHGPSIYDRLYSHPNAPDHKNDFEELLARIAPPDSGDEKKKDRNGMLRGAKSSNPYKKHYVNGSRRSSSMYSGLSSEESAPEISRSTRYRGRALGSSTDDEIKKPTSPKKKISPKVTTKGKRSPRKVERKKKKVPQSKPVVESSSEEESIKQRAKKDSARSKTLQQMEKEMTAGKTGQSGTDSDDLMPMRSTRNNKFPVDIYSDSSEELPSKKDLVSDKVKSSKIRSEKIKPELSPGENDSQQPLPRTKAAMKEFVPTQPEKKSQSKDDKPIPKKRGRKPSEKRTPIKTGGGDSDDEAKNKENIKFSKKKDNPTDLIVPQRQAAKKASENMRSTTAVKKDEGVVLEKQASGDDTKSKPKNKSKSREKEVAVSTAIIGAKVGKKKGKEIEKEPIAYVPQRQAAKKAAAHIKSGLGTKPATAETSESEKKKENDKTEQPKLSPKKDDAKSQKTSDKDSSSSSSNSSSSSYSSSSSSEEEHEKPGIKPTAKAREIKPITRQPSLFSPPPGSRPTVDLPFLDKVSRPLSSTSASSDSDSSKRSRYSGSSSPTPKRPRRRRKGKSISADTSPRKAPDKKLKTSERGSECGVPSPSAEGEESSRTDTCAATRARTRSITAGGNMPHKLDTGQRKPSRDEPEHNITSNKTPKETNQPSKLSTPERKEDEAIKEVKRDLSAQCLNKSPVKLMGPRISRSRLSIDEKDKGDIDLSSVARTSPRKNDTKLRTVASRRMSIKEPIAKTVVSPRDESVEPITKERRLSRHDSHNTLDRTNLSPLKKRNSFEKSHLDPIDKKSPLRLSDDFGCEKHWVSKVPSPNDHPPAVEKLGGNEKYMTEDKSLDSDSADKSSIKMIAKIQANLNENTMIKSPKTPMDARTIVMDPIEMENPVPRNIRKRSSADSDKKFITQDASHMQGVEISKSAKIPSTVNAFGNKIFSPQPKDDMFELDSMLRVEDSFNTHDDIIKPIELFFKEDSKEQGVQETMNLVDRLKMQLNTKKLAVENTAHDEAEYDDKELRTQESNVVTDALKIDHIIQHNENIINIHETRKPKELKISNHMPQSIQSDLSREAIEEGRHHQAVAMTSNNKWSDMNVAHNNLLKDQNIERKYDHPINYTEEIKDPPTVQSDVQSMSEVGDSVSLSKQSDDSQSLSVVDHSIPSNDQDLTQDNQTYDNNNSLIHSDCATISSPYASHRSKWRESKITTRRSSASSTNSEASGCSHQTTHEIHAMKSHLNSRDPHLANLMPEMDPYTHEIGVYACPVESPMPLSQYSSYPSDPSPFLSTISTLPMFSSAACASSLSLSSPGPGLFAPALPYCAAPLMPSLSKPAFQPLCAAFTSSSQNIALTTAMIAPPTPKPESPRDDQDATTGSDKYIHVVSSPSVSIESFNDTSNTRATKMSNDSNETLISVTTQDPKSPPKTNKPLTRFPGKSPGKSPGISPKQSETPKPKRPSNKSNRSQRGRGRSKSRAQGAHGYGTDFMGNSIQSKLVGTVYDFDEEIANDGVDLKALRDRRKSLDVREDRKSDTYKDSSRSPHIMSPLQNKKVATAESKDSKKVSSSPEQPESPSNKSGPGFSSVHPVLPGPVDMRTYQGFEGGSAPPPASTGGADHLLAFASGTADQHLPEIDEEIEKQLHSALAASKSPPTSQPAPTPVELPKVSLSDSRNQLKVKIKGPFLDANYSSATPVVTQPPAPVLEPGTSLYGTAAATSASSMMSGSTNLRRMRKKELLRQYWTQDMNMDDPANTLTAVPPPAQPSPLARAVITIPKAVASMTSIPTREDYKMIDNPIEKKKRKITSGLSRELRHLEVSMNDDVEPTDESKLSLSVAATQAIKRRGRGVGKQAPPIAPKLKIKVGSHTVHVNDESLAGCRPPKKRIIVSKPSLEDLRRESMKYRRMVMADFEEDEKQKKQNKSDKRKKKKDKKAEKLQVINSESESATKLIIKIKRKKEEEDSKAGGSSEPAEVAVDPFEYDPSAPDPLAIDPPSYAECSSAMRKIRTAKVTPIRLKLARTEGVGYVMKKEESGAAGSASASGSTSAPAATDALAVPVNNCEAR